MLGLQPSSRRPSSAPFDPAISIGDDGLVCGAGSILVRMAAIGGGRPCLLVEDDAGRLLAMLSAAFNRRVSAAEIVPHVDAASAHWSRGDKALANFRLIFARLPRLRDAVDAERLRLAEDVLDRGFPPDALMKTLGFSAAPVDFRKYREDEPRVPAGFGEQSGRWTNDPQFSSPQDRPTQVAEDDFPEEGGKDYETRRIIGRTTIKEDFEHGRAGPLRSLQGLPPGIGPGPFAAKPIPAGPSPKASAAQRGQVNEDFKKYGCHDCGTFDPGTASGNAIPDHQKPTALTQPGEQQYFYPHCLSCSKRARWPSPSFQISQGVGSWII